MFALSVAHEEISWTSFPASFFFQTSHFDDASFLLLCPVSRFSTTSFSTPFCPLLLFYLLASTSAASAYTAQPLPAIRTRVYSHIYYFPACSLLGRPTTTNQGQIQYCRLCLSSSSASSLVTTFLLPSTISKHFEHRCITTCDSARLAYPRRLPFLSPSLS